MSSQQLLLPVSVYAYDRRAKRYRLQACLQCAVCGPPLPRILTSSAGIGLLSENVELRKSAMRAPAVVLQRGVRTRIYNASCEEVPALPAMMAPLRVVRSYELSHVNLSTLLAHYRLRADGALVLVDAGRMHCAMCYVPEEMDTDHLRPHLQSRARSIHKLLRDRRLVVEMGEGRAPSVFSCETLRRRG
jgi:hypothetical protein